MHQRIKRLSAYRVMWIFVQFDLPTDTKKERKAASVFRKQLLKDGFRMFQYSTYIRHCGSRENSQVHKERVLKLVPLSGHVNIFELTDKQYGNMTIIDRRKKKTPPPKVKQLELF